MSIEFGSDDVEHEQTVVVLGGADIPIELFRPRRTGTGAAIIMGAEAFGPNTFIRRVCSRLAAAGHTVVLPDYFRGDGPTDPDDYDDLASAHHAIDALDFRRAAFDLVAAARLARSFDDVDPDRVLAWGYCTGGTLAWLLGCLDQAIAGCVLFYPSQPVFGALDDRHPAHPIDLLWALRCPTLFIYGGRDRVMPPDVLATLRNELTRWNVPADVAVYPDADHAFASVPARYRASDDRGSWRRAIDFIDTLITR